MLSNRSNHNRQHAAQALDDDLQLAVLIDDVLLLRRVGRFTKREPKKQTACVST